jgi:hypothetical protein
MSKSKDLGGGYSHLREEREYDPDTSTLRRRLALDKKPGAKEHLKRNAGTYVGAAAGLAGGRFTASKLSSMLKGKKLAGKTLAGLSGEGKMYAGGAVAGAGLNLGGKIDKGRANERIYQKLVKEGKIDAVKISKESEDPRSGRPKAVVDDDRDLFKRRVQRDALKRLEAKLDGVLNEFSDRTRNGDGQFVGGATGGADPVTMRQAYGDKPKKKNPLLAAGAGAAALAGAGLLGGTVKGRAMVAGGLRKVEGLARTGRDKLQGRVRMSKPGRGLHREARPGFGEVMQQTQTGLSESMRKRMRS